MPALLLAFLYQQVHDIHHVDRT